MAPHTPPRSPGAGKPGARLDHGIRSRDLRRAALVRSLDAIAVVLLLGMLAILATGGWGPFQRAEDVLVALTVAVAVRALVAPVTLPAVAPRTAVAASVLVYAVVMSFIVLTRHAALQTHALDLGYYVQVVWGLARGRGPYVTLPPMHAWGDHLSPILYLFAPLARLWPGANALLLAQTWILAAGAFAVFAIARRRHAPRIGAAFALLYLLNPSLHGINIRDIHPQAFAIPLLIAAALAFDARRHAWCVLSLVATLACREDAAIAVVGFAIWLALARRRWTLGITLGVAAIVLLAIDLQDVMPYFRGAPYPHLGRYAYLGDSLGDIVLSLVARPWRWLGVLVSVKNVVYALAMLGPLAFVPLLAPRTLAAAVPGLAMNVLSVDPVLVNYRAQYQSFVLPFLILAAIEGYETVAARAPSWKLGPRRSGAVALAAACFASVVLTARTVNDLTVTRWRLGDDQRAAYALMARIPPAASVSANDRLVAHLATRREVYVFPNGVGESEYVVERQVTRTPVPTEAYTSMAAQDAWVLWRRR